eukprot:1163044-Pleurochrysis_carterae.AAC.1
MCKGVRITRHLMFDSGAQTYAGASRDQCSCVEAAWRVSKAVSEHDFALQGFYSYVSTVSSVNSFLYLKERINLIHDSVIP